VIEDECVKRTKYTVTLDYGQFYLYDRRHVSAQDDDIGALLEQAITGNGIARGLGTVVVLFPHQNTFAMPLTVEQWDGPPPDDLIDWQEGYLTGLTVAEHGLMYQSPPWTATSWTIRREPGRRASPDVASSIADGPAARPGDAWRLQAWPTIAPVGPRRILYWTQPGAAEPPS
jgi:hypothetical protein